MNEDVKANETAFPPLSADELRQLEIGVVGIGAMGAGIVAFLLVAGHRVRAIEPVVENVTMARWRVVKYLESIDPRYRPKSDAVMLERLTVSADYTDLGQCALVIESVLEQMEVKHAVIRSIEEQVAETAIIGTNTSALPISLIQQAAQHPERVLGLHCGMPPMLPFIEIIKGNHTTDEAMTRAAELARLWGKDPVIVRKDIRGFVANRLGYAMYREALYLLENGVASPEDIDRASRHAIGLWAPFQGSFDDLDDTFPLTMTVMRDLFPDLSCAKEIPAFLEEMWRTGNRRFYEKNPALHREAEKRHLEGIAQKTSRALAALEATNPAEA